MIKQLLLVSLMSISTYSFSDVNKHVYNNYLALVIPEYSPHSIPIKRQEILSQVDYSGNEKIQDEEIIIESNNIGFITLINRKSEHKIFYINYEKKMCAWHHENDQIDYFNLVFNKYNDIQKIEPINNLVSGLYVYDMNNKLIKSIENFNGYDITTHFFTQILI